MSERCINLTQAEARAWAAGATALIRPLKDVPTGGLRWAQLVSPGWTGWEDMHGRPYRGLWYVGDVLIGREAHVRTTIIDLDGAAQELTVVPDVVYRADIPERETSWVSASRMPKSLARHRRPVVSVRVCRECYVTWDEASAAVGTTPVTSALQWRIAMGYLGHNFGDAWVSVTMTEAADVR